MAITTTSTVSQEQLDKVDRYLDGQTGKHFCLVTNSRNDVDEQGDLIRYRVDSHKGHLTCTYKAGQEARYTCWHKRAAAAYCESLREEQAEQAKVAGLANQGLDYETASRVVYAKSSVPSRKEQRQAAALQNNRNQGFNLMR